MAFDVRSPSLASLLTMDYSAIVVDVEFKIDYGPGYRLYAVQRGTATVILLCGGDKRKQHADIKRARAMLAELE
ncbi:type II toxin-antitoxin system RelE/ParE family toxin [Bradyrhizobium sp. LB11.1]|uniref:type II toxin-antitoxin system RelE/ParE family toxin n=1 Tax=Bradyrhizobium sp. LB11.1 TaxID=3156326 RepID=UPI0033984A17